MEAQRSFLESDVVQMAGHVFTDANMKCLKRTDFDKDPPEAADSLRNSL